MFENFAGRQYPLAIYKRIRYTDINRIQNGVALVDKVIGYITIPPKSFLSAALNIVTTAAMTGGTGTLSFINDASGAVLHAEDLTAAPGTNAIVAAGYQDSGLRIRVELDTNGVTQAALDARIEGTLILEDRSNEVMPERGDKVAAL
jgi:hypothetical protein